MSKKKTLSTMSLKDFHGGSIPSDLPLPSAPGLVGSSGSDRTLSTNWGNNLGNSDLRPRLKSPGAARNFGEKASLLSHPAPIGRNFDEDERKPLNSGLTPRRTIGDESAPTSPSVHQELKSDYVSSVRVSDRLVSSPNSVTSSSPLKVAAGDQFVVNSPIPVGSSGQNISNLNIPSGNNAQPNAWGARKEILAAEETVKSSTLSGPDAISKIAQASALEKVSSGMWQSKKPSQLLPHLLHSRDGNGDVFDDVDAISERANYDTSWRSQVESIQLAEEKNKSGFRESPKTNIEEGRTGANVGGSLLSPARLQEISEQHKMKLSSRSGLLETSQNNYRQKHQEPAFTEVKSVNKLYRNVDSPRPDATITEGESHMVEKPFERPKLNLKPRSQFLDQSVGKLEKERQTLFGGARPRELVLKERGIDEKAFSNLELGHALNRVDTPKNEISERLIPSTQRKQNTDNHAHGKRIERHSERQEQQMGRVKNDNQGRSNRTENRWSSRDADKQHQQQDQRPEPDTWRKPIEEPKVTPADAPGIYPGKVVSALDLARAFSKSVSDPKMQEQHSTPRGLPERNNQMPFSRLTDTRGRELNKAPTVWHK